MIALIYGIDKLSSDIALFEIKVYIFLLCKLLFQIKRPGREVYHSPPTSAEVKKMWIYTSTPPYAFMA
jgi:hypothetical protein